MGLFLDKVEKCVKLNIFFYFNRMFMKYHKTFKLIDNNHVVKLIIP
jgi:hypothetical protein